MLVPRQCGFSAVFSFALHTKLISVRLSEQGYYFSRKCAILEGMDNDNWLETLAQEGAYARDDTAFDTAGYHKILCPEFPDFLFDFVGLPLLQRLQGIGLLCGTDWTPLFHNRFYYSRLNHSVGTALIVWNFTHDRAQTVAALLHDVSSPTFSHVTDFRNGDALTQESTEALNIRMLADSEELLTLLEAHALDFDAVADYHMYSVADTAVPGLCADRLEYMYPSGAALNGIWSMDAIAANYAQVMLMKNKAGQLELGFRSEAAALEYTKKFCATSLILQRNEDKIAMQLMADVLSRAVECGFAKEDDFYTVSEQLLIKRFDGFAEDDADPAFTRLYRTFRSMTAIEHTEEPLADAYCVSLNVKQRYVNPLVRIASGQAKRLSAISPEADECIKAFLAYKDSTCGCVRWQH